MQDQKSNQQQAMLFKMMGHPIRLTIIKGLLAKGECNVSYMDTCLQISQSAISQHLAKLKDAGIVDCRSEKNEKYYFVSNQQVAKLIATLEGKDEA
ncbi:MAG: ArsR/SmtB family transcription factor [Erysipelotrichaceae bacterium]